METGSTTNSAGHTELLSHTLSLHHPSLVLWYGFCTLFLSLSHLCLLHNCLGADGLDSSITENMEALCVHIQAFHALKHFSSLSLLSVSQAQRSASFPSRLICLLEFLWCLPTPLGCYSSISSCLLLYLHILSFITFPSCLSCFHLKDGQISKKQNQRT